MQSNSKVQKAILPQSEIETRIFRRKLAVKRFCLGIFLFSKVQSYQEKSYYKGSISPTFLNSKVVDKCVGVFFLCVCVCVCVYQLSKFKNINNKK